MRIDFSIPERYSSRVAPGDTISFRVQGVEETFSGVIHAVEPEIDRSTRTVKVRAASDNENQLLRSGAFASVDVVIGVHEDALVIPTEALIPARDGYSVFVERSGRARSIPVETGVRTNDLVHITDGLSPGDVVLTTGLLQIENGSLINVENVEPISPENEAVQSVEFAMEDDHLIDQVPIIPEDEIAE